MEELALVQTGLQEANDGFRHSPMRVRAELAYLSRNQTRVRGEELAGPGIARLLETARSEAGRDQLDGSRVRVGIARDLAEKEVVPIRIGQDDRGSELAAAQVREGEPDENYGSC